MMTGLFIGAAFLLVVGLLLSLGRERKRPNKPLRKPRRHNAESAKNGTDEIDAYWGDALPQGFEAPRAQRPAPAAAKASAMTKDNLGRKAAPAPARVQAVQPAPAERAHGGRGAQLGADFLRWLMERNHLLPCARAFMTQADLKAAYKGLRQSAPHHTFGHGAIVHRVGQRGTLLVEPLLEVLSAPEALIEQITAAVGKSDVYLVMGLPEQGNPKLTAHIGQIIKALGIAPTHFFLRQEDGSFATHTEERRDFVPARLDANHIPLDFFGQMMDYAYARLDDGDPEAVLRTIAPLTEPLWLRTQRDDFPASLMAQALNLTGMANRAVDCGEEAVTCFQAALKLLKDQEDYEAIKAVECNLGIAMANTYPKDIDALMQACRHLHNVLSLDDNDINAWLCLAEAYRTRYELQGSGMSVLARADYAYRRVMELAPTESVKQALQDIAALRQRATKAQPAENTPPMVRNAQLEHAAPQAIPFGVAPRHEERS